MDAFGLPDALSSLRLQRNAGSVSRELTRAGEEVSTGLRSDIGEAVKSNPQKLFAIERDIALNERYATQILTAASRAELTQRSMEVLQANAQEIGVSLLAAVDRGDDFSAQFEASQALSALESSISALNSRFGERALFAGAAADGPALASADAILAEITTRLTGVTDATTAISVIDDYFNQPGGFDTTGYLGSTTDAPNAEVAEGERVTYSVRADDPAIREALHGLVLAAATVDPAIFTGSDNARLVMYRESATLSIAGVADVIERRGAVGFGEQQIEEARVRNLGEEEFLSRARLSIIGRDQFEAAAEFTALEAQLTSIFQITARLSGLNLTNFLR